jgi:hypothetical protein
LTVHLLNHGETEKKRGKEGGRKEKKEGMEGQKEGEGRKEGIVEKELEITVALGHKYKGLPKD